MTCIVGYLDRKNGCTWIGGDSLGSNGFTKEIIALGKVFKCRSHKSVVIGSTTSYRHIDLLRYSENLFPEIDAIHGAAIDHQYMVKEFVPRLVELFGTGVKDKEELERGGNLVVGAGDRLFEIQCDYSVIQPSEDFCAVGSGEIAALGSLFTTKSIKDMSIPDRILKALEAAEHVCVGVKRPFILKNTQDDSVIKVE